jgi:hypothetical protein
MHGWVTGQRPTGDRLKGEEFKRIKALLIGEGGDIPTSPAQNPSASNSVAESSPPSLPLEASDDPNLRALATLDEKLVRDVAGMHPAAARYVRRHSALSPESLTKWRAGYLPLDGGGDKRGYSLRGHLLYPMLSEEGKVLAWVGRDPAFEEKEREFLALLPAEREKRKAPHKHKVPSGFARGTHFFGQHAARLREPGYREFIGRHGLLVVEGFNDVIGLDNLGLPALGLCSNRLTEAQAEKLARWARQLAGGKVVLLLDCDDEGDDGAKEALWLLAQHSLDVRLGWSQAMHGGTFSGRQPESLSRAEWNDVFEPTIARDR